MNLQVLLASAASFGLGKKTPQATIEPEEAGTVVPRILLFSAKHPEALKRVIQDHESYCSSNPSKLQDVAYSLALKREPLSHLGFCVANGVDDWTPLFAPAHPDSFESSKLVFTFSGQGAQWAQMGKALIKNVPEFRQSIEGLDKVLSELHDGPEWNLLGMIPHPCHLSHHPPEYLLTSIQTRSWHQRRPAGFPTQSFPSRAVPQSRLPWSTFLDTTTSFQTLLSATLAVRSQLPTPQAPLMLPRQS